MVCWTTVKPKQTAEQRTKEVSKVVAQIAEGLASSRYKVKVGPQGGVAFLGVTETDRDGVTDVCIYRQVMATGSALAKMAIMRAEQLAGRGVDKTALAQGLHSHDGGQTWGSHK